MACEKRNCPSAKNYLNLRLSANRRLSLCSFSLGTIYLSLYQTCIILWLKVLVTRSCAIVLNYFLDYLTVCWEQYSSKLSANGLKEDLSLDDKLDVACTSVTSEYILPIAFLNSNTKVLTFPGKLPKYKLSYNYMDIWQPHGSQPTTKSSCAIWGSWKNQKCWRSILSFSDCRVAKTYQECLKRNAILNPGQSSLLFSHWVNLLHYIYKLNVNDGRLMLREVERNIENIVSFIKVLSFRVNH